MCFTARFAVSTGFRGSSESGSVPERSVVRSSGAPGRAAEPQVDVNTQSTHISLKRRRGDFT